MGTKPHFYYVLPFAFLFYLRVVLNEEKRIDGNHQKLTIPAVYVKAGGKKKARHDGGSLRITNWISGAT
jgi:hypothetical protein